MDVSYSASMSCSRLGELVPGVFPGGNGDGLAGIVRSSVKKSFLFYALIYIYTEKSYLRG